MKKMLFGLLVLVSLCFMGCDLSPAVADVSVVNNKSVLVMDLHNNAANTITLIFKPIQISLNLQPIIKCVLLLDICLRLIVLN